MNFIKLKFFCVYLVFFSVISAVFAENVFRLRNIYSDNMVLQRDIPVKIYGFALPGESINASLGCDIKINAQADSSGKFILHLPPMKAGGPYILTVKNSKNQEINIKNILFGEVYLASGQSNMDMRLYGCENGTKEAQSADFQQIRFVDVPHKLLHGKALEELPKAAQWQIVSPNNAAMMSAVSYYFAKEMHKNLNVPIGIIKAAWGGAQIEPWISKDIFFTDKDQIGMDDFAAYEIDFDTRKTEYNKKLLIWAEKFKNLYPALSAEANAWKNPAFDDSDWGKIKLPGFVSFFPDISWARKTVDIPEKMLGKELILTIGAVDDCDETFFNGVKIGATDIACENHWKTVRNYKIPADIVKKGKNTVAIRIFNYHAASNVESGNYGIYIADSDKQNKIDLTGEWRICTEFSVASNDIELRPKLISNSQLVWNSTMYNAMINPYIVYPIRGVIWYQGCSNANESPRYTKLFPMLIKDWRNKWNNPEMPFVFVQIASFFRHSPKARGPEDNWKKFTPLYASCEGYTAIREAQTVALALPNVGMAVAIDKGDQYDVHPTRKEPIGFRLAQEALRISFGKKGITASPYFKEMKIEGNKIRLIFDNADNGFIFEGEKINGFAIADKNGNCCVAEAEIVNGNEIIVSSPFISAPCDVYYAFCSYPGDLNLYNKEGFPMAPFRTKVPDYIKEAIKNLKK